MRAVKSIFAMLFALVVLDAIWIAGFMQGMYQTEIGGMLKAEPNWIAAVVFYLAYPVGVYILVVFPALKSGSMRTVLIGGAVLGGLAYGTFAVTNLSVLQGWTAALTVVDTLWGVFVTAVVAGLGYLLVRDIAA
jgi:uncharacterized membrane protein